MKAGGREKDYILGTHDDEVARLALQHRVWRPRALDAWRRAGFTTGQTLVDVGCGPGYATADLAEIVGPSGRVIAIDRSRHFLDQAEANFRRLGIANITPHERDLDESDMPVAGVDGAWCRWVFAFVRNPRVLLKKVCGMLKPGGRIVLHEYLDYSTWRLAPRSEEMEEFVRTVTTSWRASGGEPDIGLAIPGWLTEEGCEINSLTPIIDVVSPSNYVWQWPRSFVEVNLQRQVDLENLTRERSAEIWEAFLSRERTPTTLMITPAVLEIIATRSA